MDSSNLTASGDTEFVGRVAMSGKQNVDTLAAQLWAILREYVDCRPEVRERFLEAHVGALMRLDDLLHPMTRSAIEREELLRVQLWYLDAEPPNDQPAPP